MRQIEVAQIEYAEGGRAIWIHNKKGMTVLRIQCTGKIVEHKECQNTCDHADINVVGDIDICITDKPKKKNKKGKR